LSLRLLLSLPLFLFPLHCIYCNVFWLSLVLHSFGRTILYWSRGISYILHNPSLVMCPLFVLIPSHGS
jgi:hypothetical protein